MYSQKVIAGELEKQKQENLSINAFLVGKKSYLVTFDSKKSAKTLKTEIKMYIATRIKESYNRNITIIKDNKDKVIKQYLSMYQPRYGTKILIINGKPQQIQWKQ